MNNQQWVQIETADMSGKILGNDVHVIFPGGHEISGTLVGVHHRARPVEANSSNRSNTTLKINVGGQTVKVDFSEAELVRLLNWPQVL